MRNSEMEAAKAEEGNVGSKRIQVRLNSARSQIYFCHIPKMQVLATICVCLTSVSFGANHAITSAVIFAFQKDSDEKIKMTLEEASWLRKSKVNLSSSTSKECQRALFVS